MTLPPDEKHDQLPMVAMDESKLANTDYTFDTVSCRLLLPCGHLFRKDDVRDVLDNDLPLRHLGDRVVNPISPIDPI